MVPGVTDILVHGYENILTEPSVLIRKRYEEIVHSLQLALAWVRPDLFLLVDLQTLRL